MCLRHIPPNGTKSRICSPAVGLHRKARWGSRPPPQPTTAPPQGKIPLASKESFDQKNCPPPLGIEGARWEGVGRPPPKLPTGCRGFPSSPGGCVARPKLSGGFQTTPSEGDGQGGGLGGPRRPAPPTCPPSRPGPAPASGPARYSPTGAGPRQGGLPLSAGSQYPCLGELVRQRELFRGNNCGVESADEETGCAMAGATFLVHSSSLLGPTLFPRYVCPSTISQSAITAPFFFLWFLSQHSLDITVDQPLQKGGRKPQQ